MKKRIISLILVVVMSLLALSGCAAYRYEDDDMAKYAKFDSKAFLEGLQKLEIEEDSFGIDEEQRWLKVEDAILKEIASKVADKTVKVQEGTVGATDIFYYSYFYTITVGEGDEAKTYYFMENIAKTAELQLGLSTNKADTLVGKIETAFAKFEFKKDDSATADKNEANYFVTTTSGTVTAKEGKTVLVNVTYQKSVKNGEDTSDPVQYTNVMVEVPYTKVEEGTDVKTLDFEKQLYGKNIGSANEDITVKKDDGTEEIYSKITINFTTDFEGSECEPKVIEGLKYELQSSEKDDTKKKDAYGNEVKAGDLKDKDMVYYVFPVHYVEVESELTVETLLYKIFGENLSSSSLELFSNDDEYKNGDGISKLVDALKTKIKDYNTANTANNTKNSNYTTKLNALKSAISDDEKKANFEGLLKDALDKYDAKKAATGDAVSEALKAYETAYSALTSFLKGAEGDSDNLKKAKTEFKTAYDEKLTANEKFEKADKARTEAKDKVLGCLASKEAMSREIVRAYRQSKYDSLDSTYRTNIIDEVKHAIIHLAQECIEYKGEYPEKALKEAIERVENELKYDFYKGKYSGSNTSLSGKTNYVAFGGSYDKYLISGSDLGLKEGASKDDIKAAIEAKAKKALNDVILVYCLVDCLNDNDLANISLTEAEEKNIKTQLNSSSNVREYDLKAAYMLDKVFTYFMAQERRGDKPSTVSKPESGTSAAYDLYLEQMAKYNAVIFKNVAIASDAE